MICFRPAAAAAAFLFVALAGGDPPFAQTRPPAGGATPKLVVVLVADQMRSDYLERHASSFTGGLKRLVGEGAWFKQAAYPYLGTVTCPGHGTIGTGTFPYRHGLILNEWIDRQAGAATPCTQDAQTKLVSYDSASGRSESAKHMLVPTLAEQLRDRARGRVVTMSMKSRSAIALAGTKADAVVWFQDEGWATSSAYTKSPVPFVQQFVAANPHTADRDKIWERALPANAYSGEDDAAGERAPAGWTRAFPHPISEDGKADKLFHARWRSSPFADEYLGRLAAAAVDALRLGRGTGVDFLGISFSALDTVGHAFGPASHEVQDMVFRLDRTLGRLLDHLDSAVGRGNYVVAFTSDHGVAPIPEQAPGAGRQRAGEILGAINQALEPYLGLGQHAVVAAYTDIYLAGGVADRLQRDTRARAAALDALRKLPGISHAFTADELESADARSSSDPVKRAAALSHHRERSGDITIAPRENWLLSSAATTHGTHHAYDQRVPVLFYGAGVRAGQHALPVTPADIAPTLAALVHVRVNKTDGRSLADVLAGHASAAR